MTTQILELQQLYERDYHLWLEFTTQLLKNKNFNQLDLDNLIEEIATLGRSEKNKVISSLKLIYQHLLKWQYQTESSKSWTDTIRRERNNLADYLEDMPSLKKFLETPEAREKAYRRGRRDAIEETEILNLPQDCPFSLQEVLDLDYLP